MESYSTAAISACICCGVWYLAAGTRPQVRTLLRGAAILSLILSLFQSISYLPDLSLMLPTLTLTLLALAVYTSFRRPLPPYLLSVILTGGFCIAVCAEFLDLPGLILLVQFPAIGVTLFIARKGCARLSSPGILLAAAMAAEMAALLASFSPMPLAVAGISLFSTVALLGASVAVTRISDTYISDIQPPG